MNAVDTNILIYVNDPRDAAKRRIATALVAELTDGVLLKLSILLALPPPIARKPA
jgi:predicted nucleic acid-binding protein